MRSRLEPPRAMLQYEIVYLDVTLVSSLVKPLYCIQNMSRVQVIFFIQNGPDLIKMLGIKTCISS